MLVPFLRPPIQSASFCGAQTYARALFSFRAMTPYVLLETAPKKHPLIFPRVQMAHIQHWDQLCRATALSPSTSSCKNVLSSKGIYLPWFSHSPDRYGHSSSPTRFCEPSRRRIAFCSQQRLFSLSHTATRLHNGELRIVRSWCRQLLHATSSAVDTTMT